MSRHFLLIVVLILVAFGPGRAKAFTLVFSEQTDYGLVRAYVSNAGHPTEAWKFTATTAFGDSITIDLNVRSEEVFVQFPDMVGQFVTIPGIAEASGWAEFTSGDLAGFFSDSSGYIFDPGAGGGGVPPTIIERSVTKEQRWNAMIMLANELESISERKASQRGYAGCVGSVLGTIGGTILGAQQHGQNVRGHRLGRVARSAVRASLVGVGAVAVGGAIVSAGVCLSVFLTD